MLAKKPNRGRPARRGAKARRESASVSRARNRKTKAPQTAKPGRAPLSPAARKVRNRTVLALLLLALLNAYVFVWRDGGTLGAGANLEAAIGSGKGPLPAFAEPPDEACGGDPVRIFEGLENLVALRSSLTGASTLRLALLRLGVPSDEIDRLETAVRSKVDLGVLGGSGAPIAIAADRYGGVHALEIELAEGHVLQACRQDGEFAVRNIQHPLRTDVEVVSIELGTDAGLSAAVVAAGEKPELASLIARTLAWDVDFLTQARPGDRIQVMLEKRWLGRRFHRYGAVLAIRFRGAAARVNYYRYKPEGGEPAFFNGDGEAVKRAMYRSPVAYFPVDVEARGLLEPSIEVVEGRIGAVFRVPQGAPVLALGDGSVRAVGRTLEEGTFIDLELTTGEVLRYANLMRTIGELEAGVEVEQGEVIALAGHTGRTPYDRVRLELWIEQEGVSLTGDPMLLRAEGTGRPDVVGSPIPDDQRERFEKDVAPWRRALRSAR